MDTITFFCVVFYPNDIEERLVLDFDINGAIAIW